MKSPLPTSRRATYCAVTLLTSLAIIGVSAHGQTTYTTYTAIPDNFTQVTQDNIPDNKSYAGFFSSTASDQSPVLGLYANGGDGGTGTSPEAVGFRTFTTDGTDSTSTALPLQVGQSFTIHVSTGSNSLSGNSIGFSLNSGTATGTVQDYNTGGRLEYSLTAGDSTAALYDGNGKETSGLPSASNFQSGQTYTVTLVSTNEFNFSVAGGPSYNVTALGGTAGAAINSFSVFNRGYNNPDADFASISVSNNAAISLTANSGETKTVTGVINNNSTTGTNSIEKLGTGTVVLQANNTFVGATTVSAGTLQVANDNGATTSGQLSATSNITVNAGGTLALSGSSAVTDRLNDNATVTLNGGTLNTGGLHEGAAGAAGVGALTLQANSVLDLSTAGSLIAFADSHGSTWTAGTTLSIYDYTPGSDNVYFGSDTAGLTAAQLSQIEFYSGTGTGDLGSAEILGTGEIVPVPEPATALAGSLMVGMVGFSQRRRFSGLFAAHLA